MSNAKNSNSSNDKKVNGSVIISKRTLILLLSSLLFFMVFSIVLSVNWNNRTDPTLPGVSNGNTFHPNIDPDAGAWIQGTLPEKGNSANLGIQIPGYSYITLPADQREVPVALLNPEGNPCYFTFELVLRDTGEVLYTSKMVPPGYVITQIALTRPLPAGKYPATIRISTASLTDGSSMNGANVETVLIVE